MVIAIIAVLAAILSPVFANAHEAARKTACLSNQKPLGMTARMYLEDYDDEAAGPTRIPRGNCEHQPPGRRGSARDRNVTFS
jgi:hypothetical protein